MVFSIELIEYVSLFLIERTSSISFIRLTQILADKNILYF